jgi:L-ascorbate metabolism protein UlaG (beta-lactamase superfamily)
MDRSAVFVIFHTMLLTFIIILILGLAFYIFLRQPQFGGRPSGEELEKLSQSPNYKNGAFQNESFTPQLTEGATVPGIMADFFLKKRERSKPSGTLPTQKTDLLLMDKDHDIFVWFGHSSYFIQIGRRTILVDPVLSGHASPVRFTTKSFKGSDVYEVGELPIIDYLFLTHDHYDHFDYKTLKAIQPKTRKIFTGLGVAPHLRRWGFDPRRIKEMDWNEMFQAEEDFIIRTVPARHFSGRGFKRNNSIWLSFILETPDMKIFAGGDSGYDTHFKTIGEQFGPFDLAILENGQYNKNWKYIHMMPEEAVQAAIDLRARKLLPVHWGKFSLSLHSWDEPIIRLTKEAEKKGVAVVHPMIGEGVELKDPKADTKWWEGIK